MEDAGTNFDVVPLPEYLMKWLRRLEPTDTAVNAHKISEEQWSDFKEQAANIFHALSSEDKDEIMAMERSLGMTKKEMFEEKVDEEREVWRIVQDMCILERTEGRRGISTWTLHGPNGPVKSLIMNSETGEVKPLIQQCAICSVHSTKRCGGCRMFYYCGIEHQKKHWAEGHQNTCKTLKRGDSK
jgi:hypothetical protein